MNIEQLEDYCEAEFENLDIVYAELVSILASDKPEYSTMELAAMAAFIHNCYNGMENVLKRILMFSNIETKDTPAWHKDLLKSCFDEGIVSSELYDALSSYLSFRHFFVHAYSFRLRWSELKPLIDDLKNTLREFKSTVYRYIGKHRSASKQAFPGSDL